MHSVQQPEPVEQQHNHSSPDSSTDIDDDMLFEVTLKSNALRALRQAELCGPALTEKECTGAEAANCGL
jgi:hypothetical protein